MLTKTLVHVASTFCGSYCPAVMQGYGLPQGDLIQEGNLGLMKAVKRSTQTWAYAWSLCGALD